MPPTLPQPSEFSAVTVSPDQVDVDLLFVPVAGKDDDCDDLPGIDAATAGEWSRALASGEFRARPHDLFVTPLTGGHWRARRVAFVGAGDASDAEHRRRVGATCGYAARSRSATSIGYVVRRQEDVVAAAGAAADGLSAGEFDNGAYKNHGDPGQYPSRVVIVGTSADAAALEAAVRRGRILGESANIARALANEPANVLTPREFATRVTAVATRVGCSVELLDEHNLRDLGMNLLMAVAQGSAEPPRLITIRHSPPGAPTAPVLALVGKGVTFDTGGISIKPADGMERMKDDMAGGAAVAAAMRALALLKCPYRVIGMIPTVENMPGGRATRPGDVVRGANGKTVEIINTDAEGRLILADALWYAQKEGATHLVDVATLTGACMVALGRTVSGLFGTPNAWVEAVKGAAMRGGDNVWHMPIYEEAREQLRSEIADMINSAGRAGGAVTAAAFLREFAEVPWAHLDIAGTAWAEDKKTYQPKGATGVAMRTLVELAMSGAQ